MPDDPAQAPASAPPGITATLGQVANGVGFVPEHNVTLASHTPATT
jgi:hypothetical protein